MMKHAHRTPPLFGPVASPLAELATAQPAEPRPTSARADPQARVVQPPIDSIRQVRSTEAAARRVTAGARGLRVALYSHDTLGLGHLRRNLLIAQALAESDLQATNLLVTGAYEANFFSFPVGVDCLTLPRLEKDNDGSYGAGQLALPIVDLVQLRASAITSALSRYDPDLLIVDKVPGGAFGELLPALRMLSKRGRVRSILGIRDVLDDAATVQAEWADSNSDAIIGAFYDGIWVYGDQQVYDPRQEYRWSSEIAAMTRFTGYLDQRRRLNRTTPDTDRWVAKLRRDGRSLFVCTLGGGKDGFALAESFLTAMKDRPDCGVLLAGPFMSRDLYASLQASARDHCHLHVLDFSPEADRLIQQADGVIAMGGYNTVASILSFQKPALIVPRVEPRREQWIRAERLAELHAIDVIHPENATPEIIGEWTKKIRGWGRADRLRGRINLGGLRRVVEFATELADQRQEKTPTASTSRVEP